MGKCQRINLESHSRGLGFPMPKEVREGGGLQLPLLNFVIVVVEFCYYRIYFLF